MERFSDAFKAKYQSDDIAAVETCLDRLDARKTPEIDVLTLSPVATMPSKIHDLLQIGLRRMIELTEASIRELNRENPTSTFVLVRAALETSCLLFDAAGQNQEDA